MAISKSGSRSVKEQIADALRAEILDGSRRPESKLPTEAELMELHEVARNTARDALGILVNEGLIESRRPQGYFVRSRKRMDYRPQSDLQIPTRNPEQDSFLTEQGKAGREPRQTIDVAIVEPPNEVRERLNLGSGEMAVLRRRARFLDGEPFLTNDSYFPLELVQGTEIMTPIDIARGANRVLAESGHVQVRATDEIFVRMPTPTERSRLDLAPGTPVAVHVITGYSQEDRPLRCVISVLPGDRHTIIFERQGFNPDDIERKDEAGDA